MKKTIIETGSIDLLHLFQDVSIEAKKEKNSIPPLNKMAYWWTRKPLIVSRAVVLASTLDTVAAVRSLLHLNATKRSYTYPPDHLKYNKLLNAKASNIKILDPFGGGGSLTFEAKCLGLSCTTSDYNPFAYMIQKATLEFPSTYGSQLIADVEKYANAVINKTKSELSKFYSNYDLTYFWSWCIRCPHCNQRFPLTNHMYLVNAPRKKIGIILSSHNDDFCVTIKDPISVADGTKFTQKHGNAICIKCQNTISYKELTRQISSKKDKSLLAIQTKLGAQKNYRSTTKNDNTFVLNASRYLQTNLNYFYSKDFISTDKIKANNRNPLWNYGIKTWNQFFTDRQLLVIVTYIKHTQEILQTIQDPSYRKVISVYLGLLLCKHINSNSLGTGFEAPRETPGVATVMRQPRILYNHAEINPFAKVRGSFYNSLKNILDAIKFSTRCPSTPLVNLNSVLDIKHDYYDIIITDPPYADDVPYGELSDFFYVWFYRCVKQQFSELPSIVSLDDDFCESHGRFKSKKLAKDFFSVGLHKSFLAMSNALKSDGLLVCFFAHSTTEAWNLLLQCIFNAKLQVISANAVHTESISNPLARNKASFMSSIVVACRKITNNSSVYFEDLKPKIFMKIGELLDQIEQQQLMVMPVTDLLIMVYGKVLEVATGYTELKSYEKDFQPSIETLISEARNHMMVQLMSKVTDRYSESLDSVTNISILAKVFYAGKLPADEFSKIIKAYGMYTKHLPSHILKSHKGSIEFLSLHDVGRNLLPQNIHNHDVYSQLCYLASLAFHKDASHAKSFLSSGDATSFNLKKIKPLISLFIKSYIIHSNRAMPLTLNDKHEFETLKNLAAVLDLKISKEATLFTFDEPLKADGALS